MPAKSSYSAEELYTLGAPLLYQGQQLNEIRFPLGGIGTGCVSLSGRGELLDWEIFNRPNKGSVLPFSFITLWVKPEDMPSLTRVVQAQPAPPFTGQGGGDYRGYGFGAPRDNGWGLPHMRGASMRGEFPFAEILFEDAALPLQVKLEAYSPFIPLNPDDSGIPIAVLRYHIRNTSQHPIELSLAANLFNPIGYPGAGLFSGKFLGQNRNAYQDNGQVRGLVMSSDRLSVSDPAYGTLCLSTTWERVFHQNCWLRSGWFDAMHDFWDHFSTTGTLPERDLGPSADGASDIGTLGLQASLLPGESVVLPIFISWHFPNYTKYWGVSEANCACGEAKPGPSWRNYYATVFKDALDAATYYARNAERLYADTRRFHSALFSCTLPSYVLDAVSSQTAILHSPTVIRLEDGTFYGFEGCAATAGCCEGSCTHVWNYAQTTAFLFPALERSLREADYTYNITSNGYMGFRLQLPLGSPAWNFHAAADGQLGGIIKMYRDWKLCGDTGWLRKWWPKVKLALEFAWTQWDTDSDGVIDGVQHNTYDVEFYGPNSMIGTFYLAALRAAEEMARALGDEESAAKYNSIFQKGRQKLESELYNGEYYRQKVNVDPEPKYQYGEGCLSDQLIGQWLAHIVGLGYVLEPEHVRSALAAVYEHNWLTDFHEHANPQRIYALNDEQGLILCSWPRGSRPAFPFPYSDEVWCGIEYQVASHLITEGFVAEGLSIVKGIRARHDGYRRNPWNEFECGSHYARSLASWAILTALTGYQFDMPHKHLGFSPRVWPDCFKSLWTVDSGWGTYEQDINSSSARVTLQLMAGSLELQSLSLGSLNEMRVASATVGARQLAVTSGKRGEGLEVTFSEALQLSEGQSLELEFIC
ncbi:MAG: non-lysosomal glucosylceramidase [Chloroflexi bacterium]|nr:non-lysosomal glucosylceramidase [Chloroflexota bacterium]